MAGNLGDLVQMIGVLSGVQSKKRELDLSEQQLQQQASQFAQTGDEAKFASALKLIAGSSAKSRQGLETLIASLAPQHRAAAEAFLQGQPIDPSVVRAGEAQTGLANMPAGQRAVAQNEAATQDVTGMNVGQMGTSQLGGTLATGAIPAVTPAMTQSYAQRAASGQTPIDAAVGQAQMAGGMVPYMASVGAGRTLTAPQAAQIGVQQGQLNLGWAGLDREERNMAAQYDLDKMLKTAEAQKYMNGGAGTLTGQAWLDGMAKLPTIINDINKNASDKAGNLARLKVYNTLAVALGQSQLVLPLAGPGTPSGTTAFEQLQNSVFGSPSVGGVTVPMPWPTPGGGGGNVYRGPQ